jgi:hypothetical protein
MSFVGYGVGHVIYLSYSLRQRELQSTSNV